MSINKKFEKETLLDSYTPNFSLPFHISLQGSKRKYDRDGHWNQKQRLKNLLEDPLKIRSIRIYQMMSDMIITRNANQCRSHHQKMEKYRNTIPQIIASVAQRYEPNCYLELSKKYQVLIKTLLQNQSRYIRLIPLQEKHQKNKTNFEPTIVSMINAKKEEIKNIDLVNMIEEDKDIKEDRVKTSDSYEQDEMEQNEEQDHLAIPQMKLDNPKLQEEYQPKSLWNSQNLVGYPSLDYGFIGGFQQNIDRMNYFNEQLNVLVLKKQWHEHNIKQLSQQIINQREAINLCEKTIQFCSKILPVSHQI